MFAPDRIEDFGARQLPLHVLRHVAVAEPGLSGATPLQIEDAELPRLKRRILAEHFDDRLRVGSLLQFLEHEHLVRVRAIHAGLAGELERDGALDGAGGAVAGLPGAEDLPGVLDRDLDAPPGGVPLDDLRG